jgi:hypothetical protein
MRSITLERLEALCFGFVEYHITTSVHTSVQTTSSQNSFWFCLSGDHYSPSAPQFTVNANATSLATSLSVFPALGI